MPSRSSRLDGGHEHCGLRGIVARIHSLPRKPLADNWLRQDAGLEKHELLGGRLGPLADFSIKNLHFAELSIRNRHQADLSVGG